jgi:hypothetical protein
MRNIFIFTVLLISGCKQLTPQEFVDYVNNPENGFVQKQKINKYSFEVQYLPPDYLALQFALSGIEPDFDKLKDEADSTLNFKLTICSEDSVPLDRKSDAYKEKVNYLNNDFIQSCALVTNKDTLLPIIHHYEMNPNIKPCDNVMFAFENSKKVKPIKIIIVAPLYSIKPFEFDVQKIKTLNIPKIKL